MRLLFSFAGGQGHFQPLAPLARAAREAGHEIAFACQPAMLAAVAAAGFTAFDTGGNTTNTSRKPLLPVDDARERRAVTHAYAGSIARDRAPRLAALARRWSARVLVSDEMDFAGPAAAELLGIPHATVLVIAAAGFAPPDLLAQPLAALRATLGLPAAAPPAQLTLSPFPAALRPTPDVLRFRPGRFGPPPATEWRAGLPPGPIIHATLGTVFNLESGDLFARLLAGLRTLPANLVMTLGGTIAPAEFGPLPPHVRILDYVPVDSLLPACSLVVSHGGSGIVTATLAHGLPALLLPMGADQPLTAAACRTLGAALVLDPVSATPAAIHAAARRLLDDPAPRAAAAAIAATMRDLPDAAIAAARIASLAA